MINESIRASEWADSHIFFNEYLFKNSYQNRGQISLLEIEWRKKLLNLPNGHLLLKNKFFTSIGKHGKFYMLHITTKLDNILKHNTLYPSAGCLVGSIYCSPLYKKQDRYFLHNLGEYILKTEAPRVLKNENHTGQISSLILEVDIPYGLSPIGVDYLKLGNIHYDIYNQLKYLLSSKERFNLEDNILNRIKKSTDFIALCQGIVFNNLTVSTEEFFTRLINTIKNLPILGYIYFEVLSEYISLSTSDNESKKIIENGEIPNKGYKELTYELYSGLTKEFNLSNFAPTIRALTFQLSKLNNKNFFVVNTSLLLKFVQERIAYLLISRLSSLNHGSFNLSNIITDYDFILEYLKPLFGHLIHRELRNFHRYNDFYFYFDQLKALQIWNYWNYTDTIIPFNGILPKGEIGLNPAYPKLCYKVYLGKMCKVKNEEYLITDKELNINIMPRLVDFKYSFMRNNKL
jgi:hypothetical protein